MMASVAEFKDEAGEDQKKVTNKPNLKSVSFPRQPTSSLQNIFGKRLRDPISGEIGKSIVFAVSQHQRQAHADFNEIAD